jgi:hypothetical protein
MPTRLTPAGDGCNPERVRGTRACREKTPRDRNRRRSARGQGKERMVKAKLPEPQTRGLLRTLGAATVDAPYRVTGDRPQIGRLIPATRPTLRRKVNGRTRHLTAPHLSNRVITGRPKRACLTRPVWSQTCRSSQTPGVTPWTAAPKRTVMGETDRATGRGNPADRVKGRTPVENRGFTAEVR